MWLQLTETHSFCAGLFVTLSHTTLARFHYCFYVFYVSLLIVVVVILSDVDECTASSPVCDGNAICNNTLGSYRCTCKPGYFEDGKTCKGKYAKANVNAVSQCQREGRQNQFQFSILFHLLAMK